MKKTLAALAAAGALVLAGPASATEMWEPHLPGVDEGLAAGALPPPGVYGILDNYLASLNIYNQNAKKVTNSGLSALVEVPVVLWATGVKVLGADYAVAIAQPFDYTSFAPQQAGTGGPGNWGTFNTVLVPGQLAWTLGDFHVNAGLSILLDDATSTMADVIKRHYLKGGLPSGIGYTVIQPDLGLSWLHDGWNISASLHLPIAVDADVAPGWNYKSGNMFEADYTVTKTIDKWTFGAGAHGVNQLNSDTCKGALCGLGNSTNAHNIEVRYGVGPIVGYQFGGINIQATWNHDVYTRNAPGGDIVNVRFLVPF